MYQFEEEVKEKKTEKTTTKEGSTNASEVRLMVFRAPIAAPMPLSKMS